MVHAGANASSYQLHHGADRFTLNTGRTYDALGVNLTKIYIRHKCQKKRKQERPAVAEYTVRCQTVIILPTADVLRIKYRSRGTVIL